jgi:diguanylate cyclase (GGDEF)-like protein
MCGSRGWGEALGDETVRGAIEAELAKHGAGPFPATLEALYQERRRGPRQARLSRALVTMGPLMFACSALDWLIDPAVAAQGVYSRALAGALCVICGLAIRDANSDWLEDLLLALPILTCMLITQILGEMVPERFADRYMMAAICLVGGLTVTLPARQSTKWYLCLAAAVSFPVVLGLLHGGMTLGDNLDVPAFAAGGFAVALLVSRRNEIGRRRNFLLTMRDQLTAAEMNLLNTELLRLSTTDPLTGLSNRRQIETEMTRLWLDRQQAELGVALIDVDHFKRFNDAAGHAAGDACLRQVARALAGAIRHDRDRAARYGGEEFVVLLPGLPAGEMEAAGERLRQAVENLGLAHPGLPGGHLTISVGLAWCAGGQREGTADRLLRDADHALYAAKGAGRNRVMAVWQVA